MSDYKENYRVRPTKKAFKQGRDIPLKERYKIIDHMKGLKYWDQNKDEYEYENAYGAIEFKFNIRDGWVRVFVYKEDYRKIMHVVHVIKKKQNSLKLKDQIPVETAVARIQQHVKKLKIEDSVKSKMEKSGLIVIKGGSNEK